jgi:hypothetical protein
MSLSHQSSTILTLSPAPPAPHSSSARHMLLLHMKNTVSDCPCIISVISSDPRSLLFLHTRVALFSVHVLFSLHQHSFWSFSPYTGTPPLRSPPVVHAKDTQILP